MCDACGAPVSLQHGLDYAKGGLVKKGHNGLRDSDARIADVAWDGLIIESSLFQRMTRKADQNHKP